MNIIIKEKQNKAGEFEGKKITSMHIKYNSVKEFVEEMEELELLEDLKGLSIDKSTFEKILANKNVQKNIQIDKSTNILDDDIRIFENGMVVLIEIEDEHSN